MRVSDFNDTFQDKRENIGTENFNDQNDSVTMVLRHKDVRKCAHNWKIYQSGGKEIGRIVIPSEENIRDIRQIPFEVDPPEHKGYRDLLETWFKRPIQNEYIAELTKIIENIIDENLNKDLCEVVTEFALVLQSRALTLLLNVPLEESKRWISWGTHVFRSEETNLDISKANILYDYVNSQIDVAISNPGDDLYSFLLSSEINGKRLTKEEVKGIMILTFAGGRDTIINAVTNSVAYFAEHPKSLKYIKEKPEIINNAVEELIRYFTPLTQMGRVVKEDTNICEHVLKANSKISLCWASANRDESVFEKPNEVILDRKINPHLSFGFGTHNCLGASQTRSILRIMLKVMSEKLSSIEVKEAKENIEDLEVFQRKVGFNTLKVQFKS